MNTSNEQVISFRCYYPDDPTCQSHYQLLPLKEIPKWIQAYKFTHPNCIAISVKVWFPKFEEKA